MNTFKKTIKFALLGTVVAALGALTSCSCGSNPDPVQVTPPYVAPVTK